MPSLSVNGEFFEMEEMTLNQLILKTLMGFLQLEGLLFSSKYYISLHPYLPYNLHKNSFIKMVPSTDEYPDPSTLNALAIFSFMSIFFIGFTLPLLKNEKV